MKTETNATGRRCGSCRFFDNTPEAFERGFPGLTAFGSASASVRDEDGICALHDRHLAASSCCENYEAALV